MYFLSVSDAPKGFHSVPPRISFDRAVSAGAQ